PSWAAWHEAFLGFNHTNSSSVLPNLLHMEQKKTLRFNNYSNPALELQEEIMASFYILIIVGFFGFLLFVMMLSNIVSSKPENYMDYLYSGKLSPPRGQLELPQTLSKDTRDTRDTRDTFVIINSAAFLGLQGQEGTEQPGTEGLSTNSVLRDV
uniref:Uncharacterized protein n=1 Tax=Serinus canaria TaxID=9135 RepID=A0A8C9N899_SERCA